MTGHLGRREFITLVGGAATAWPLAAHAQQGTKVARIGFLGSTSPSGVEGRLARFRAGLRDLSYVEGENILIDFRWAEGNYNRLTEFAAELIRLKVDVLVTYGTPGTLAAKKATTTIPIVMTASGDAVASGIVASLAHPGGNVTGSTFFGPELSAKRLELLKEVYPSASRVGVLINPDSPYDALLIEPMRTAAKSLKFDLQQLQARRPNQIEDTISTARAKARVDALVVTDDLLFVGNLEWIAELANNNRLPAIGTSEFAQAGGLIGYGVDIPELWYRAASFVDKILKGAKPADLPVEQPTKFVLIANVRVAKTLGLELPPTLLARSDEVIE
jgi:putative ABC transport system substrate-binding protein